MYPLYVPDCNGDIKGNASSACADRAARLCLALYRRIAYNCIMETKQASSIRLTLEAKRLLRAIAMASGVSMSAILELMIREKARRESIK